jgi:hypothetical protein
MKPTIRSASFAPPLPTILANPTHVLTSIAVGTFQVKSQNAHKVPLYALRLGYRLIGTILNQFIDLDVSVASH